MGIGDRLEGPVFLVRTSLIDPSLNEIRLRLRESGPSGGIRSPGSIECIRAISSLSAAFPGRMIWYPSRIRVAEPRSSRRNEPLEWRDPPVAGVAPPDQNRLDVLEVSTPRVVSGAPRHRAARGRRIGLIPTDAPGAALQQQDWPEHGSCPSCYVRSRSCYSIKCEVDMFRTAPSVPIRCPLVQARCSAPGRPEPRVELPLSRALPAPDAGCRGPPGLVTIF